MKVVKIQSISFAAFQVILSYFIISVLWIYGSDHLLEMFISDVSTMTKMQNIKGWFFVTVTSAYLFFLVKNKIQNERASQNRYKFIFDSLPISLWEEDIRDLRKWQSSLPVRSGEEFLKYLDNNPQELMKAASLFKVIDANPATISMYQGKDLNDLINNFESIMGQDSFIAFKEELVAIFAGDRLYQRECVGFRLNGEPFNFLLKVWIPLPSEQLPLLVTMVDITTQKLTEQRLKEASESYLEASRAKSEFLAIMGHEIRTPMNVIAGIVELLCEQPHSTETSSDYLTVLRKNSQSMLNILNSLIDLSRFEAGKIELNESSFSLQEMTDNILSVCNYYADSKKILLSLETSSELPKELYGDQQRIEQIIVNLTTNAIKFTDQGSVKISISKNMQTSLYPIKISIEDTGIGMDKDEIPKVFEMFTQGDSSNTRRYGGSGIGLTLTKRLVDLMKGEMHVVSKKGVGTIITLFLNILPKIVARDVPKVKTDKELVHQKLKHKKILMVEDSEDNRFLLAQILKKFEVELVIAEDGEIGLAKFKEHQFDLVLMDIQMPVMNGLTATKLMREFEVVSSRTKAKILFMSAFTLSTDIQASEEAGGDDFIPKPIKADLLYQKLVDLIS